MTLDCVWRAKLGGVGRVEESNPRLIWLYFACLVQYLDSSLDVKWLHCMDLVFTSLQSTFVDDIPRIRSGEDALLLVDIS